MVTLNVFTLVVDERVGNMFMGGGGGGGGGAAVGSDACGVTGGKSAASRALYAAATSCRRASTCSLSALSRDSYCYL